MVQFGDGYNARQLEIGVDLSRSGDNVPPDGGDALQGAL